MRTTYRLSHIGRLQYVGWFIGVVCGDVRKCVDKCRAVYDAGTAENTPLSYFVAFSFVTHVPGHVKRPRTQVHYVQVSVAGSKLIPNVFQMDVEARTSNSAALFAGGLLTDTIGEILWGYPSLLDLLY